MNRKQRDRHWTDRQTLDRHKFRERQKKETESQTQRNTLFPLFEVNIINHIDEEKRDSPSLPSKQRMKFTKNCLVFLFKNIQRVYSFESAIAKRLINY